MSDSTPSPAQTPSGTLEILRTRVYRGPNVWSYDQCVHLLVDLGPLEEWPSDRIPGFVDRLMAVLPGVGDHSCSRGKRGGFLERLQEGTWLGHVAEHVALQLQAEAGHEVRRGKTRSADKPGQYNVIYGYLDERVAVAAGRLAVRLVNHLVEPDPEFDFDAEFERFLLDAERYAFGPSTQALVDEAASRDIPYIRLNSGSLVQFGQGVHQRRIRATMTSQTGALATDIASDKELTARLLGAAGLPVPQSQSCRTPEQAVRLAERIGFPVVLKPADGNHGRGVQLDLRTPEAVEQAFPAAKEQARNGRVIVETYYTGKDYRVLVVGGHMVAVAERVPAHVIGDGEHTITELVDIVNADPRRGVGHEKVLTRIRVNAAAEELVAAQGYAMDDVPPLGAEVKLAATGNMSTGGISIDRTYDAHPDNIEIAEEAARVVGLDVAGIDFICPDIAETVRETGGGICEVNAAPGFRMHTHPTVGEPQFVAKAVIDGLFPAGSPARVPIVAVTGTNGKTTTARMIAAIFKGMGRKVGMTSTDGITIDQRLIIQADASGPKSARMVLQNPRVDFAVLEVARGGILREGLGYDRNDVAVVTNVAPDHLGLGGINTLDQLADVKAVVVEAVPRDGFAVLNADDPLVAQMRRRCRGEVIWVSLGGPGSQGRELAEAACRRGGTAVLLDSDERGEYIFLRQGRRSMRLTYCDRLPATYGGKARFNVMNAMAAAGAAFAQGAHLHDIRAGLTGFLPTWDSAPGRLNHIDVNGVHGFVDYAHNAAGLRALGEFLLSYLDGLTKSSHDIARRRCIGVVGTAGDRRDEDIIDLGRTAAEFFDVIIIREDKKRRGREVGEVAGLIAEGVSQQPNGRTRQTVTILDEVEAARHALSLANPGDVLAVMGDDMQALADTLMDAAHSG
ncbi:MAG: cyanophycin synthetase [Actinobacteria bacterium]|jgi:cyanophycin synthetase|nr:cyanophycin synthetase [Actinomycetota bacterium]